MRIFCQVTQPRITWRGADCSQCPTPPSAASDTAQPLLVPCRMRIAIDALRRPGRGASVAVGVMIVVPTLRRILKFVRIRGQLRDELIDRLDRQVLVEHLVDE